LRTADPSGGGVPVLGGDHVLRVLLYDPAVITAAHDRHLVAQVLDGDLDGSGVRGLDLLALPRISERPNGRDGLRGAERDINPATSTAARALRTQPPARAWMATIHQRDEVRARDRLTGVHRQPSQRLRVCEPTASGLRHLLVWGQVVVASLGRDCLALQVARVAATSSRRDARCSHHISNDPERPKTANELHSARTPGAHPCISSVLAVGAKRRGRCPGRVSGSRGRAVRAARCGRASAADRCRDRPRLGVGQTQLEIGWPLFASWGH
jgi:hypothetical protein